jgi:high-affinity iron transporter
MKKLLLVILVFSSLFLAACGGGAGEVATPDSIPDEFAGKVNPLGADAATAGAVIFKNNCTACHGEQGHGDGPAGASLSPAPKNLPELASTVGDDYLFWRIATGKSGTSMVGWKGILTDDQIWQAVAFINTLK